MPGALSGWKSLAGTKWLGQNGEMTPEPATYSGYRFPAEIISYAVSLYHLFGLGLREADRILSEQGIGVTCWATSASSLETTSQTHPPARRQNRQSKATEAIEGKSR